MTQEEKTHIVSEVLEAIRAGCRTIEQLTPVGEIQDADLFELSGGRNISFGALSGEMTTVLREALVEIINNAVSAEASIRSAADEALDERLTYVEGNKIDRSELVDTMQYYRPQPISEGAVHNVIDGLGAGLQQMQENLQIQIDELGGSVDHPIEVRIVDDADLAFADSEGNRIVEFTGGHIKTQNFDSADIDMPIIKEETNDADLAFSDEAGRDIVKFVRGHVKTTNFDSEALKEPVIAEEVEGADLTFSDEAGHDIVRFARGHVKTSNFDSEALKEPVVAENIEGADLALADEKGNDIVRFSRGHVKTTNFDSENLPAEEHLSFGETDGADLAFSDGNGNRIVTFTRGHIKTSNFDSENIQAGGGSESYSRFRGKKLSIIGDSISTFGEKNTARYPAFYPNGDILTPNRTWFQQVLEATGMELLKNRSWSGCRVTGESQDATGETACSTQRVLDLADGETTPDVIIIYVGANDYAYEQGQGRMIAPDNTEEYLHNKDIPPEGNLTYFADAYLMMVYKVITTYPEALVYCCTMLDFGDNNAIYPVKNHRELRMTDYNEAVKVICKLLGARLIDLHSCGINCMTWRTYLSDGTHPNAKGAKLMAEYITSKL